MSQLASDAVVVHQLIIRCTMWSAGQSRLCSRVHGRPQAAIHVHHRVPAPRAPTLHAQQAQLCLPSRSLHDYLPHARFIGSNERSIRAAAGHGAPPSTLNTLTPKPPARLAVFVSGGGSNMKAIHAAIMDGRINAKIEVIVSDVPTCAGVAYAQQNGIPTLTYPIPKKGGHPGLTATELVDALKGTHACDFVILAGYLKLIPAELVKAFPKAMLNIHPGLLPSFGGKGMYGIRVHQAVVASGARFSGPTVHFVDEEFDTGPILAQRCVPVYPTDTPQHVAARVLKEEHIVYPRAVSALVDGRITWREDGVPIMWEAH